MKFKENKDINNETKAFTEINIKQDKVHVRKSDAKNMKNHKQMEPDMEPTTIRNQLENNLKQSPEGPGAPKTLYFQR